MTDRKAERRDRRIRYGKARVRNFIFTVGPGRLTRGRLARRHLSKAMHLNETELFTPAWPEAFDGLRIGHVSDFHLGELITIDRALEAVDLLRDEEPDLIACTGDIVDLRADGADELLDALASVAPPLGVMLVLGNHDELHSPRTIRRFARRAGVQVLDDEAVELHCNGAVLTVAGIGWSSTLTGCAKRVDRVAGAGADLLLAHNPRAFLRAAELGVALTLSGHTHGGQVAVPKRPNTNLALGHKLSAGVFERGDARLFVTTGVGSWFPLRINCPAEVAMITMRSGTGREGEANRE